MSAMHFDRRRTPCALVIRRKAKDGVSIATTTRADFPFSIWRGQLLPSAFWIAKPFRQICSTRAFTMAGIVLGQSENMTTIWSASPIAFSAVRMFSGGSVINSAGSGKTTGLIAAISMR